MAVAQELPRGAFVTERHDVDLTNGGIITVLIGEGGDIPTEFNFNPLVKGLTHGSLRTGHIADQIPSNTKLLIFGPGQKLPKPHFHAVHAVLKARRLPYRLCDNPTALHGVLSQVLQSKVAIPVSTLADEGPRPRPAAPAPRVETPVGKGQIADALTTAQVEESAERKRVQAGHGTVQALMNELMPALQKEFPMEGHAAIAKRIFPIAQERAMPSSVAALAQAVMKWRRDNRTGTIPDSVKPQEQRTTEGIDEAVELAKGVVEFLVKIRDGYAAKVAEVEKLRAKLGKAAEVFNAFRDDVLGDD